MTSNSTPNWPQHYVPSALEWSNWWSLKVDATSGSITTPIISGGTADGVVIGGVTPAAGIFTTLSATQTIAINGPNSAQKEIILQTGGQDRWHVIADSDTDGTPNAASGSTFRVVGYGAGYGSHNMLSIDRSSGTASFGGPITSLQSSFGAGSVSANYLSGRADLTGGTNWNSKARGAGVSNIFVAGGVTNSSGQSPSGVASVNYFAVSGDTLNASTYGANIFEVDHNFGGTGYAGSRNTFLAQCTMTGPTSGTFQNTLGAFWGFGSYNAGGTSYTSPGGYLYGLNPQIVLNPGASWWTLANAGGEFDITVVSNNQTLTVGGTVTVGDVITCTFTGSSISGSPVSVGYTVATGNTAFHIIRGIQSAVMASTALSAAGVTANVQPGATSLMTFYWPSLSAITVSTSLSGGATETLTLGTAVNNGATVRQKLGMSIIRESADSQQGGGGTDSAIVIGGQNNSIMGGWNYGIQFTGGAWGLANNATLIANLPNPFDGGSSRDGYLPAPQLARGIDLSLTYITDRSLYMPGFAVSGSGSVSIYNATLSSTTSGMSIDIAGYKGSGNATIVTAGGGGSGGTTGNYFVGDIVNDSYGGQHLVTSVNTSTGGVTGITTLIQPYVSSGSSPSTTQNANNGSGNGLQIGITWVPANTIAISPSGGNTTIGGAFSPNKPGTVILLCHKTLTSRRWFPRYWALTDGGRIWISSPRVVAVKPVSTPTSMR